MCVFVCVCLQKVERDPEVIRREMELQLEAWSKLAQGTREEVRQMQDMWSKLFLFNYLHINRTVISLFKNFAFKIKLCKTLLCLSIQNTSSNQYSIVCCHYKIFRLMLSAESHSQVVIYKMNHKPHKCMIYPLFCVFKNSTVKQKTIPNCNALHCLDTEIAVVSLHL